MEDTMSYVAVHQQETAWADDQSRMRTLDNTALYKHFRGWSAALYSSFVLVTGPFTHCQARAEGGAVGAWAPAPFPLDAKSALLSRQLFFLFFFYYYYFVIKRPFVKACPI